MTQTELKESLREIKDPELGFDIVALGLIYSVAIDAGRCVIRMTLTMPGCPDGPQIVAAVRAKVRTVTGLDAVDVQLVWDPPWTAEDMADEDVRFMMGIYR
ncbi:MAG: DUF59 domain-containing protein [Candidatus Riflebacteria bacterium]|nr:DUF59 domain-containing protein [Candidatus Riflebacteria bacterium]